MTDLGLKYFSRIEFVMGSVVVADEMDRSFLELLDKLRDEVGFALTINSSFRSPEYNASIKGASRSKHMEGIAVDIACSNSIRRAIIVMTALNLGLSVGVGKTFIHVDNRPNQLMFTY